MIVIDTVAAESLEVGDVISLNGATCDLISWSETIDCVHLGVYNLDTGDTEKVNVPFYQLIDILGV